VVSASGIRVPCAGFTVVEMMVAAAILMVVLVIVLGITEQTQIGLKFSTDKIEAFQNARAAFEAITRAVSSATLNTYYDYYNASRERRTPANATAFVPAAYGRYSELEFVSGKTLVSAPRSQITHSIFFQSPLSYTQDTKYANLVESLNVTGFFLDFHHDGSERPGFYRAKPRYRYRLMQLLEPTESFSVYSPNASNHSWLTGPISRTNPPVRLLAENIVALVIWPKLPEETPGGSQLLARDFEYDSRIANASPPTAWTADQPQPAKMNQLPPVVRVLMIAVDERSMARLQGDSTSQPDLGFDYASVFQSANKLDEDIETVSDALTAKNINFRIFQTDIVIRGAKWSS